MRCKYPERDLPQRLDGTVCRYKDKAVFVRVVDRGVMALYELGTGNLVDEVGANHPDFDISTVPLGYAQVAPDKVAYIKRRPSRAWKQGVSQESLRITPLSRDTGGAFNINSIAFANMVNGNYPDMRASLQEIMKSETRTEIAISRDVALVWSPERGVTYVYYKEDQVGFISQDNPDTIIIKSYEMGWIITNFLSNFAWEIR